MKNKFRKINPFKLIQNEYILKKAYSFIIYKKILSCGLYKKIMNTIKGNEH